MRKGGRVGGVVVKGVLTFVVIYLIFTAAYYLIRDQGSVGSNSTNVTTSIGSVTTTISLTTATDNMSLAQLETLSFDSAGKCDGLLDSESWDIVLTTSGSATAHLAQDTVYGLMDSTNQWATLFREDMRDPPSWLSLGLGNYTANLEARLAAQVMGTNNITLAKEVMRNYTSYVSGLSAAGVDFISFGGLSGLRIYSDTGDIDQAVAATFPGQMYQLYSLSQDCSYSKEERAKFLGYALSMTGLVVATSGKGGFGPKFEGLLTKLGLHDAWPKIKFHLKEISSISPGAAYETTMVLASLAKKFPTSFNEVAPFVSSRIAVMVQILKEKGLSAAEIEQKVGQLTNAVRESGNAERVAEVADKISYEYEGSLRVKVRGDFIPVLSSGVRPDYIRASFVEAILPGFKEGERTAIKVTVHEGFFDLPSYHVYEGGKFVAFTLPREQVRPGNTVGLSFELLPVEAFAREIPSFALTNPAHLSWVADSVVLKDFKVIGGVLEFRVLQKNPFSSTGEFSIKGEVVKYPGVSNQYGGVYAEFGIKDYAGRVRDLRIRYDGFSSVGLQIVHVNSPTTSVSLISYDGFRLSIAYGSDNQVATIYMKPPSVLIYNLGTMHTYSGSYLNLVQGKYTKAFQIDSVEMLRNLEKEMLGHGSTYEVGRLGAEIGYVVGDKNLGLKEIVLEEPAKGGRDLYTQDNKVAIQARLLTDFTRGDRDTKIQEALLSLVKKLGQDYENQPQMQKGYAILSYVDTDGTVRTIILEVPRP